MTRLTQHVQREVPRFAECARRLADADSLDVDRLQSRHEPPIAWQVRRTSPKDLPRRQSAAAALAGELSIDDSSQGRSLTAVVETCGNTAGVSTRAAAPNGHA